MKFCLFIICSLALCACGSAPSFADYKTLIAPQDAAASRGGNFVLRSSADALVQNGDAYECVSLNLPPFIREIKLPKNTIVRESKERGKAAVYLKKSLGYMGHPGKEVTSIYKESKKMGVAVRVEGNCLWVALYGTWGSFEGGSDIQAAILLPSGIRVKEHSHLKFEDTEEWEGTKHFRPSEWFLLPTSPDPARYFEKFSTE